MEKNNFSYSLQFLMLIGLSLVGGIIFFLLSAAIVIPFFGMDSLLTEGFTGSLSDPKTIAALKIMQLFNAVGIFIVPPFLFAYWIKKQPKIYFQLSESPKIINLFLVSVLMLAAMPVINFMAEMNSQMQLPEFFEGMEAWMKAKEEEAAMLTEAFLKMENGYDLAYNLLLIAIIPAFGEELLFRGAIQKIVSKWTKNAHAGIWIAAFLFSAMHGQFYGFFPRMFLGAMFGYLLLWSGSLWLPVLAHFVNNGAAVLVAYFVGKETISNEIETIGANNESLIYVAFSFVVCGGLLFIIKRQSSNSETITEP